MTTDPRDPQLRIERLLDPSTIELLTPRDSSGMIAATGAIKGNRVVVFASDATIQGGALGVEGAHVIVSAYRNAITNYWIMAFRWCAFTRWSLITECLW